MRHDRQDTRAPRRRRLTAVLATLVLTVLAHLPAGAAQLKSIQSGEVTIFTGSTSAVVPITPVDPAKTILVFSTRTNTDDPDETQTAGNFTTGQNDELTFARHGTVGSVRVYWYLAEFVSGVSVQRGSANLTGLTTVVNIGAVDLAKSFPLVSYRQSGPDWDGNDFVRTTLPSSTQLQLDVADTPNASAVVEWQVVEYADAVVRSHGATMLSGQTLVGVTPGYAINPSKMWLVYSYSGPDSDEKISRYMVRGFFDGGGGFSFDRYNTGVELEISAFVVEFTDVTTVQHGTATWAIGPPLNLPVTIPSAVDLASSIAVGGYQNKGGKSNLDTTDSGISTAWAQMKLTGPTSMIVHRGRADEAAQIEWSVIEFSEPAPAWSISGTVFEDVNYGGGIGRDRATAAGVARSATRVELYDAAGVYVTFTTTDGSGNYSFAGLAGGDYTVRVVNSTLTSSRTGYVPGLVGVQTYRTDAGSGSAVPVTNRVGGEDPRVADAGNGSAGATMNTTTGVFTAVVTGTAQSITNVTVGAGDVTGLDFGFNFNTIVNTNDAGQGSFRQFKFNANALSNTGLAQLGRPAGIDSAIFMLADGTARPGLTAAYPTQFTGGFATIKPLSLILAFTDPVILDASTQPGFSGSPIIELDGSTGGAGPDGLTFTGGGSTLRGWIINRFPSNGVYVAGNGANTFHGNYIGTNAAGTSAAANGANGISIAGQPNNVIGGPNPGEPNVVAGNNGNGISIIGAGGTGHSVIGNFIGVNGSGTPIPNAMNGIRIRESDSNTIGGTGAGEANTIAHNSKHGVLLYNNGAAAPTGNRITGNSIHDNTFLGIDLSAAASIDGDGVTPNNGTTNPALPNIEHDYPVISEASRSGATLHVEGYVGTASSKIAAVQTIEVFKADDDGTNNGEIEAGDLLGVAHGEGRWYVDSCATAADGTFSCDLTIPGTVTLNVGDPITATATNALNNTSEFGANATVGTIVSGTIFEDVNYGGGAGRDLATAGAAAPSFTVERGNVTVELYDAAGSFLGSTTSSVADGTYSFSGLAAAVYTVRVVNDTVTSTRPGSDGSELGVQVYRIDGDGESAGAGTRKVGGELPSNEDAAANSGAQTLASLQGTDLDADGVTEWTQSIVEVDLSGGAVTGVDFGFNFDVVVNTNDAGQGSLRQFILNSNLLN